MCVCLCVDLEPWPLPCDILVAIVQGSVCDTQREHFEETALPDHDFLGNLSFRRLLSARVSVPFWMERVRSLRPRGPWGAEPAVRGAPLSLQSQEAVPPRAVSPGSLDSRAAAPSPPSSCLLRSGSAVGALRLLCPAVSYTQTTSENRK